MKLQTIVAPSDLEEGSLPGLRAAADLARDNGARLVVVHVLTSRSVDTTAPFHEERPIREEVTGRAQERLETQVAQLSGGVDLETRLVWGDPVDAVVDLANSLGADLIVITVKNRSRVGKLLMGSQAQNLILSAERPVLTVPLPRK